MLEITYRLFEMLALVVCLHSLNGEKLKIDVYNVVFVGIEMSFMQMIQEGIVSKGMYFAIYLIYFIYAYLKFGDNVKRTVLKCLLVIIIVGVLQMIAYLPAYFLSGFIKNESMIALLINLTVLAILLFTGRCGIYLKITEIFVNRDWILRANVVICFFIVMYYVISLKGSNYIKIDIFALMIIFMTMFMIFIYRWQKSTHELNQHKKELQITNLYNGVFEEMINTIRNRQHDFNNQIDAIYATHLTARSLEELIESQKKYCDNVLYVNRFAKVLSCTKNSILAGFIYTKFIEAENKGIEVKYDITYTDICKMVIYDLVDVIGILLDNAIEAVTAKDVSKKIIFELRDVDGLILMVKNPVTNISNGEIENFFQRGYSTKGEGRGLGLNKLVELQKKYEYDVYAYIDNYNKIDWIKIGIIMK